MLTLNPSGLVFDEDRHEYRMDGRLVESVTRVLSVAHSFDGVPKSILEPAQQRGTAAHLACEFDDQGDLDEESLSPQLDALLQGWRKFRKDFRPRWLGIESRLYHRTLGYAGTADRFADIGGKVWCIDIKTSKVAHPSWGMQTAAYSHAAGVPDAARMTVRLTPGGYHVDQWSDPDDWDAFRGLLAYGRWERKRRKS